MQSSKSNYWRVETNNITINRGGAALCLLPLGKKLELSAKLMGEQAICYDVTVAQPLDLRAGDYIEWQSIRYSLFEEPDHKRAAGGYTYNLVFYAPYHRLSHILHKDEGATSFPYCGSLREHLNALLKSIRAVDPDFTLGTVEENGTQLIEFADTYCIDALTQICEAFGMEWEVHNKTINVQKRIGVDTSYRFAYGYGSGLYSLEKAGVTNSKVATRLYGRGSSQNLPPKYREGDNPRPETLVFGGRYLEKNTAKYGVREDVVTFEEIYPRLKDAAVTAVTAPAEIAATASWAVQVSLPFDLNAQLGEEEAQIKFITGELTGEAFTVTSYNHKNGLLKFNASEDNGYVMPSETRQPRIGDQYVLLNIVMPQSYVDEAEAELKEATQAELDKRCEKQYAYTLNIDPRHMKRNNIQVLCGDSVVVCEEPWAAGNSIRVTELSYPLYDPRRLSVVLSDTVLYSSYAEKVENDIKDVTHEINNVHREARAFSRRAWRDAEELAAMLETLRADLVLVGNHAGQFVVSSTFTANKSNDPNLFTATEGKLQHAVYKGATDGVWLLGGANITLETDAAYYLYAKCDKTSGNGLFYASTEKIEVEGVEGWYHFPVGVISSPFENARVFNTTYGFTQVAGGSITTGKLQDPARRMVVDLDNGTITGPVRFTAGTAGLDQVAEWPDAARDIEEAQAAGNQGIRDAAAAATAAGQALADASQALAVTDNFTSISGGLLLTTLIKMLTSGKETGGLSANLDNVLLWGGGTYVDALQNLAKIILRHDGSGQLAGGKIQWSGNGDLQIGKGAKMGDFYVGLRMIDSWMANVLELDKTSDMTGRTIISFAQAAMRDGITDLSLNIAAYFETDMSNRYNRTAYFKGCTEFNGSIIATGKVTISATGDVVIAAPNGKTLPFILNGLPSGTTNEAHIKALPLGSVFIDSGQKSNGSAMLRIRVE